MVNNSITDILDEKNYIKDQYYLEISSPGIERNLRRKEQFESNIGNKIEVHLYKQVDGKKVIVGNLKEFSEEYIIVDDKKIENKNIASAKTVYNWEE